MIVGINVTDGDILVFKTRSFHPCQEKFEESIKKVAKEVDIGVCFCDNDYDLANATGEDLVVGRLEGKIR